MSEGGIRFERKDGFTILYNSLVRDPRLSLKTKGLMAVIVSLPETWNYNISGLATVCGVGKDAIRGSLNELEEAGYLDREQAHNEAGKFTGNVYVIHEHSTKPMDGTAAPLSENPTTAEPSSGKPTSDKPSTENPTLYKKEQVKKEPDTPRKPPKGERRGKELPQAVKDLLNDYVGRDKELAEAMQAFMEVRAALRAVNSERAVKTILNELDKLSGGDRGLKLALINQSVGASWKFVYPIKGAGSAPPRREEVSRIVV